MKRPLYSNPSLQHHSTLCCIMNRKVETNNVSIRTVHSVKSYKFEVQSFGLDAGTQSFRYLFIALSITRCSKSAQKLTVRMCQVATVVMATTQLVLSQFKNFLSYQFRIEWGLSLPKIISKCCELVKLCHINRTGPVSLRQCIHTSFVLCMILIYNINCLCFIADVQKLEFKFHCRTKFNHITYSADPNNNDLLCNWYSIV